MKKLLVALMFAGLLVSGSAIVFAQDGGTTSVEEVATPAADVTPAPPETPPDVPGAAEATPTDPTPSSIVLALQNGHWFLAFGGILWIVIAAIRKWAWEPKARWMKYALAAFLSGGGVLTLASQVGVSFSWGLLGSAVVAAATAAWTHHTAKDVLPEK